MDSELEERLVVSKNAHCICGEPYAFDRTEGDNANWECHGILTGTANGSAPHSHPIPLVMK